MSNFNRRDFIKTGFGTILMVSGLKNLSLPIYAHRAASPLTLDASKNPPPVIENFLKMGNVRNSRGDVLTADSRSILLNGKRRLPVMGEFHFARYPESEWREELLKMKMGGIDILATYIFWIHHEEVEGVFDWSGQRNLRKFIELSKEVGLHSIVRLGPWCHGEVRNGGLPDWILKKPYKTRTDAPEYLEKVLILYGEIANQIKGLLWKDGGNIIGAQFENEFKGRAEHLLNLKRIALEKGIDVPLYTRTAWHSMASPLPLGEIIPLFGAYAEGFWDRELTPMPGKYGDGFLFRTARIDASIATDQLGTGARKDTEDVNAYPYFCCEIGGGMMTSYHRRILNYAKDIESIALVKIGAGNNLQGFYMYHGGTNPEGKQTTLQESQATNYWNDLPVKSYDFQAPLGEFGQINDHYHVLRNHHMFLRDFGADLANMTAYLPDAQPKDSKDAETLRWSARTDGNSGYVFVNNYQRLQKMPVKRNVQFQVKLDDSILTFPQKPFSVPEDAIFFFPFNLKIADANLIYATAQPLCKLENNDETYLFFLEITSIPAEFKFDEKTRLISEKPLMGSCTLHSYQTASGKSIKIVSFNELQFSRIWKGNLQGRERVFLTDAALVLDGDNIRLSSKGAEPLPVSIYPPPSALSINSKQIKPQLAGIFGEFTVAKPKNTQPKIQTQQIKQADAPREIKMGSKGVAEAPSDTDFERAAVWKISLPKNLDKQKKMLLRIGYNGDVARIYLGDQLLTDNFYNGRVFELGLNRYAPEIYQKDLFLKILPLRKDAPIYLQDDAKPNFEGKDSICRLLTTDLIEIHEVTLKVT